MSEKNEWKLVPVIATDEMEAAAEDDYEHTGATFPNWKSAYAAMLAAAPSCLTCGGHGMVGGLTQHSGYDAEPCPDCTPAPSAPGDAQDERQAFEAWFARRGVWPALCFEEVFIAGWNARPADAPAAGDALDAARYRWLRDQTETDGIAIVMKDKHFDESSTCAENIDKFIDAALAAQVPQQGEA